MGMNKIGTITESSLHAAMKNVYALPGDRIEEPVLGCYVDILRPGEIVEIQTGNFDSLHRKLATLLPSNRVRVVLPVALERHIIRIAKDGSIISRRRSPKKGRVEDLFNELIRIPAFLNHPNLIIEIAWVNDEIHWVDDGKGSWRRKHWSIKDRVLVKFLSAQSFSAQEEYAKLIPSALNEKFTSRQFARASQLPIRQAARMLYCFRAMGLVEVIGRQGNAYVYRCYTGQG